MIYTSGYRTNMAATQFDNRFVSRYAKIGRYNSKLIMTDLTLYNN